MYGSDAYWEGYRAYQDGASIDDNPYSPEGRMCEFWFDWKEGFYDAGWDD